ncbi:MAG: isoprenylcysteine carboxylmethyltransferase family protein [Verrucomicrobiota bacterium]
MSSVGWYLILCGAVGAGRLIEMTLSRRHQRALAKQGAPLLPERAFLAMVILHTGVIAGAAIEVVALHRRFVPAVGIPALIALLAANLLRWWVIATLGVHWNVRVVRSMELGVVTGGPYRYIRHPNYVAVFLELLALPLVHGAVVTAVVGSALHVLVLRRRIALEESVLMADETYRSAMGGKPRFIPRVGAEARPWPTTPTS